MDPLSRELLIASRVGRMRAPWGATRRVELPSGRVAVRAVTNGTSGVLAVEVNARQNPFELSKESNISPTSITSQVTPEGSTSEAASCLLLPSEVLFLGNTTSVPVSVSQTRM